MSTLPDDVRILFEGPNYAHLATLLPHGVPLWVDVEGDRLAFLTSLGSRRARNIACDPRACVSVTAHDQPFTMASVRGRVVERVEGDAAWEVIDRISRTYTGQPYSPRAEPRSSFSANHCPE